MGQLQEIENEIIELGYRIIAISPDRPDNLKKGEKIKDVKYELYSDSTSIAAIAFGLAFKVDDETNKKYLKWGINLEAASGTGNHYLPVPAAYVVGTDGMIKFEYVDPNYRVRIDPQLLLKAAEVNLPDRSGE